MSSESSKNKINYYATAYGVLILKEEKVWFAEISSTNDEILTVINLTEVEGLKEIAQGKHLWKRLLPGNGDSEARQAYKAIENGKACLAIVTFEKPLSGSISTQVIEVKKSAVIDDSKQEVIIANNSIRNYLSDLKYQSSKKDISIIGKNSSAEIEDQLTIDLVKIEIGSPGNKIHFRGVLIVDNERICRITSPGDGVIIADQWNEGCSAKDIEMLDLYIAATGEPRDDGETPDTLAAHIIDRVSMHVAIQAYRQTTINTTLFFLESDNEQKILSIEIPVGGTREEAREVMKNSYPSAASLDLMTEEEAAIMWMTFS